MCAFRRYSEEQRLRGARGEPLTDFPRRAAVIGRKLWRASAITCCLALLTACATPVGVKRMNPQAVQRELTRSILTSDTLSTPTRNALFQHDLVQRWQDDPAGTIAALHARVAQGDARRNDIFALAELSFAHAEAANDPAYHRGAAVYAWLFLFPTDEQTPLDPLDPRTRAAADLYNRGLAQGFASGPNGEFVPCQGRYDVPFGYLDVYFDATTLERGQRKLTNFVPVAELDVRGLPTRYRSPGVGAPLAASTEPIDPAQGYDDFVEPWSKVPVTALLRMDDIQAQLPTGRVAGWLTLEFAIGRKDVEINGEPVGLETETTAALAYTFAESPVWQREIGGFLQRMGAIDKKTQLASLSPYRPGRIPVVLVHGTASSPGRWAAMMNELGNDPRIGPRVQAWLFTYDTGNPIGYSAMLLRESLRTAVARLDPDGKDPALRAMVVIGHSQGGLLTKSTAIDSGDRLWRTVSSRPFEEMDLDPEQREMMRKIVFVEPVPSVKRVVFLATPHRGSYIAGSWLAHQAAKLIVLPADLTRLGTAAVTRNREKLNAGISGFGTSVFGMTPGQPFLETLVTIPFVPGVKAHSIIAVQDLDVPREQASDGVVKYKSAHIDGVDSEYVVVSGHSCQDNPHTIQEVRRILLEHIAAYDAAHRAPPSPAERGGTDDQRARDTDAPARPALPPGP
jgi:pimeloyl-ACP methyl ester carboxylesterase